jgi:hypothetical protein
MATRARLGPDDGRLGFRGGEEGWSATLKSRKRRNGADNASLLQDASRGGVEYLGVGLLGEGCGLAMVFACFLLTVLELHRKLNWQSQVAGTGARKGQRQINTSRSHAPAPESHCFVG